MNMRICLFIAAMVVAAILSPHRADAQVPPASDDPLQQLQHGHALLIGNSHYRDPHWPPLDDVPLQLDALQRGLLGHFDSVDVAPDLETKKLQQTITDFLQTYGNDDNARLFIYYAGHGYTELIPERNENRGYITGVDTPWINMDQWNPAGLQHSPHQGDLDGVHTRAFGRRPSKIHSLCVRQLLCRNGFH